jgi:hypothetical protein
MHELRKEVPSHIAIQGNLDPEILKGPLEILQAKAKCILDSMKGERDSSSTWAMELFLKLQWKRPMARRIYQTF